MISMPVELYTDGSCLKNPGLGGYSYIIRYFETQKEDDMPEQKFIEFNQGYRLTTNNRMELMGVINGINAIIDKYKDGTFEGVTQINGYSDSEYVVRPINLRWLSKWMENNWMTSAYKDKPSKPVKNKDLWEKLVEAQNELKNIGLNFTISHVDGHNGNTFNERADKLAVAASTGTDHLIDEVYEKTMTVYNKR